MNNGKPTLEKENCYWTIQNCNLAIQNSQRLIENRP